MKKLFLLTKMLLVMTLLTVASNAWGDPASLTALSGTTTFNTSYTWGLSYAKNAVCYNSDNTIMMWSNGMALNIDSKGKINSDSGLAIGNSSKKSAFVFKVSGISNISVGIARNNSDMTASLYYLGESTDVLTDPNNMSPTGALSSVSITSSNTTGTLTKTNGAAGYYMVFGTLRFITSSITITAGKTVTSKVLTGINISGSAWDIAGLTDNAATISEEQKGLPVVEFVYTINYDDKSSDTNQKETVIATKSGSNYVAASTVLTNNATLTFTDVLPYIFNMTEVTGPTSAITHGTGASVTANFNDVVGTSAYVYNGHGSNDEVVMVYNTDYITLNSSSASYFKATFNLALAEGDVINCSNKTASTFKIGNSDNKDKATGVTFPYVIPSGSGLIGKKEVYVFKVGGTPEFQTFSIARNPKHSVTYSIGSGTGTTPTQANVPETGTFTVASADGFTAPSGKTFSHWSDGTNDYDAGDTYTMGTDDVTLTAVYETSITASFNNGGHGTAPEAQATTGSVTLSPIKTDWYENNKWVADRDVEVDDKTVTAGDEIAAGKTVVMSENTTFTAQWTYTGVPYVAGIAFATPAANALDLRTQALFTPSDGYVVLNPNSVRDNNTTGYWLTSRNAGRSGFTWTAPEGSVFYSNTTDNESALCLQQQKTYAVKFTGTTEFKALMNSRKDGTSNKVKAMLVDYNGATPQKVGDVVEIGNFGKDANPTLTNDAIVAFSGLDASHTYVVFFYGFDTSTNGVLYEVAFKQYSVAATIGSYGYATFSSTYPVDIANATPAGLKAYKATSCDGSTVHMEEVTGTVAANTGLVLKGAAGTYNIPVVATGDDVEGNLLHGCDGSWSTLSVSGDGTNYVLSVQEISEVETVVWAPVTDGNNLPSLSAGQAYLYVPGSSPARGLRMVFPGDVITGVANVEAAEAAEKDGKFIINGQLVIKKNGKKFNAAGQQVK